MVITIITTSNCKFSVLWSDACRCDSQRAEKENGKSLGTTDGNHNGTSKLFQRVIWG